jgi:hypothetical protein
MKQEIIELDGANNLDETKTPDIEENPEKETIAGTEEGASKANENFDKNVINEAINKIRGVESLEEMLNAIKDIGDIKMPDQENFKADNWLELIPVIAKDIKSKRIELDKALVSVTGKLGLRSKFEEIMRKYEENEKKRSDEISKCENFGELYEVLSKSGEIYSTDASLSSNKWISAIEFVRTELKNHEINLDSQSQVLRSITRSMGLREKVKELIIKERG